MKNLIGYFSAIVFVIGIIFTAGTILAKNEQTTEKVKVVEVKTEKLAEKTTENEKKVEKLEISQNFIAEKTKSIDTKLDALVALLIDMKEEQGKKKGK